MNEPLAERMRPTTWDDFVGQEKLLSPEGSLRKFIEQDIVPSMILWGPPGTGKTSLARFIAAKTKLPFYALSAIDSGVKEIRAILDKVKESGKSILFIDEIHRFNKSQQDALLGAVESGAITLIGATTENPSFEVNRALLSRSQVYVLNELSKKDLDSLLFKALAKDSVLKEDSIELKETEALIYHSGGDARKLFNVLEIMAHSLDKPKIITNKAVEETIQRKMAYHDKSGDAHYDLASAFIKSIRGSDPNAALFYLAKLMDGGEDPKFIARRLLILSAEDIGLANPNALLLANTCFDAVQKIGYPECDLILSQTVIYLATSPKSNSAYLAIRKAQQLVKAQNELSIPLHIRNAPTKLMKDLNYGKEYQYAHNFEGNFVHLEFLPNGLEGTTFYEPGNNAKENELRKKLKENWKEKYGY